MKSRRTQLPLTLEWKGRESFGHYESVNGQFRVEPLTQDAYRGDYNIRHGFKWTLRRYQDGRWVAVAGARSLRAAKVKAERPGTWDMDV